MPVTHARLLAICFKAHLWPFMIYAIRLLKTFHVTLFQKCFLTLTLKVDRFPLEIWASHICHPKNLVDRTFNENLRSTVRGCNAKRPKTATPNRVVCWSLLSHESESWTEARCMYVFFCFFRVRFLLTSELCCRSLWGCQWEDFLIIRLK